MKDHQYRMLTMVTALWVIVMPFVRTQMQAVVSRCPFSFAAGKFLPEFVVAAVFLLLLPAIWRRKRWVSSVLVALALLLPVLVFAHSATVLWIVSYVLLLWLAYAVHPAESQPASSSMQSTVAALLGLASVFLFLATPAVYLQLSAGALGAIGGLQRGHWLLALALLLFSLLGLYGLWTMWSISTRTWAHARYVMYSDDGRMTDARGLFAAWVAIIGLAAISTSIYRVDDVVILGVLLAPPLLMTTLAASMNAPERVDGRRGLSLSGLVRRTSVRHCVGIACGITVGVLAVIPLTHSGYGFCGLTDMFPIGGDLWPTERPIVFGLHGGCDTGLFGQTLLLVVASFVFWLSGLLTVVIGRSTDAWLGAITAAVIALAVLAWAVTARVILVLALPQDPLPPISDYINFVSTGMGIAVVLWAARLGYLGGRRGARPVELQTISTERIGSEAG